MSRLTLKALFFDDHCCRRLCRVRLPVELVVNFNGFEARRDGMCPEMYDEVLVWTLTINDGPDGVLTSFPRFGLERRF